MQVIIFDDAQQVAEHAALRVQGLLTQQPSAVLGLATGSTPIQLYRELVKLHQRQGLDFSRVTTFNLDEYYNILADNPQSYRSFMTEHLFNHININLNNTHLPTCDQGQNPRRQGGVYDLKIAQAGGIDLQILGLGANGHIGFNEPTSSLASRTRIKTLTQQTILDNSRLFSDDEYQPDMAMTMGIATILDSQNILLMATGRHKAQAVKLMIAGPVSASCPASSLQMHEHTVILLDREASSELENTGYYTWVNKLNMPLNVLYGFYS